MRDKLSKINIKKDWQGLNCEYELSFTLGFGLIEAC